MNENKNKAIKTEDNSLAKKNKKAKTAQLTHTPHVFGEDEDGGKKNFGKLIEMDLREYWKDEARNFTPWLSEKENLQQLGTAIGMDLELEGTEQLAGDHFTGDNFKVDIIARIINDDIEEDCFVVIENQLGKTDHDHLGKLLTYTAGRQAKAVVWIAKEIRSAHREALDWLNENIEKTAFFGLEIKVWKIKNSLPAPQFHLVAKPNEWAKSVRNPKVLSPTQKLQWELWSEWLGYMKGKKTNFTLGRNPQPGYFYSISVGKSGFHLALLLYKDRVGCELCVKPKRLSALSQLKKNKEAIEKELYLDESWIEWLGPPEREGGNIIQYKKADWQNKKERESLFEWFRDRASTFYKVFSKRLQNLDLEEDSSFVA